jgi:hypothetical protein
MKKKKKTSLPCFPYVWVLFFHWKYDPGGMLQIKKNRAWLVVAVGGISSSKWDDDLGLYPRRILS